MFGGEFKTANKIDWENEKFFLVPLGKDTQTKGQVYSIVNEDNKAYQMFVDDGEGNKVPRAIFIGTREQPFLELVRKPRACFNSWKQSKKLKKVKLLI